MFELQLVPKNVNPANSLKLIFIDVLNLQEVFPSTLTLKYSKKEMNGVKYGCVIKYIEEIVFCFKKSRD